MIRKLIFMTLIFLVGCSGGNSNYTENDIKSPVHLVENEKSRQSERSSPSRKTVPRAVSAEAKSAIINDCIKSGDASQYCKCRFNAFLNIYGNTAVDKLASFLTVNDSDGAKSFGVGLGMSDPLKAAKFGDTRKDCKE